MSFTPSVVARYISLSTLKPDKKPIYIEYISKLIIWNYKIKITFPLLYHPSNQPRQSTIQPYQIPLRTNLNHTLQSPSKPSIKPSHQTTPSSPLIKPPHQTPLSKLPIKPHQSMVSMNLNRCWMMTAAFRLFMYLSCCL